MNKQHFRFGAGLDEVDEMTPSTGYNICEFDRFAPTGEKLTLLAHVDKYSDASLLELHYRQHGLDIKIYPTNEDLGLKETRRIILRQMAKYIYKNKGSFSKHQERQADHICSQLDNSVWEMRDPRRPILPTENFRLTKIGRAHV